MFRKKPSVNEYRRERFSASGLAALQRAFQRDGCLVIEQVVDRAFLSRLHARMTEDTEALLAFCTRLGGNPRDRGHLQQGPPPIAQYLHNSVTHNPFVLQLTMALLDGAACCQFYNGNTNAPGSTWQRVHLDGQHVDATATVAGPTYAVVVNVVTQDVTLANGPVELWPQTHKIVTSSPVPGPTLVAQRRRVAPEPGTLKQGDVLVRDVRLWHRGVPSTASEPRHMVAMIHSNSVAAQHALPFDADCEAILRAADVHTGFDFNARFDQPIRGNEAPTAASGACVDTGQRTAFDYLFGPTRNLYDRRCHRVPGTG